MNFLQKYEKKLFPKLHEARYTSRIEKVLKLKQKWLQNPDSVAFDEVRVTLRVLKYKNILPPDPKHQKLESEFMLKASSSSISSMIFCIVPWLFRQFHSFTSVNKVTVSLLVFVAAYGIQVYDKYMELDRYNRQVGRKFISELKVEQ